MNPNTPKKHSPGPWSVEDPFGTTLAIVQSGKLPSEWGFIAEIDLSDESISFDEATANANLIAASPELFAFVEECANDFDDRVSPRLKDKAKQIINKAKGIK